MDEKLVEQISTDTGVPQELVSRSAQARAQAMELMLTQFSQVGPAEKLQQ